jgi:hypothetical protein
MMARDALVVRHRFVVEKRAVREVRDCERPGRRAGLADALFTQTQRRVLSLIFSLSFDGRFDLAYNAPHALSLAALR